MITFVTIEVIILFTILFCVIAMLRDIQLRLSDIDMRMRLANYSSTKGELKS